MSWPFRKRRACSEAIEPGHGWQVQHRLDHSSEDQEFYIPEKLGRELPAKASPVLAFVSLILTWFLSTLFAIRFSHVSVFGLNMVLVLQFILWTIIRQGMAIIALLAFELRYTNTPRKGKRRTLSLYDLDAWMSLIIRPINVLKFKLLNVLLILIPSALSFLATYATSDLLGPRAEFTLRESGTESIRIAAAGGGGPHRYIMTGQEFVYNASQGCLEIPNNRFVHIWKENQVLIPSIPEMGTYDDQSSVRAANFSGIPAVLATVSARVEANRSVEPPKAQGITTVPSLGDVSVRSSPIDLSSSNVRVELLMMSQGIYKQIYLDIHYRAVSADLLFATFNNGTHINRMYGMRNVTQDIPARLNGSRSLEMDSVLENFIFSQNGADLIKANRADDNDVKNLGLLLASAFGIRSASWQNWIDGAGEFEATVFHELEMVKIARRYWVVAGLVSGVLGIACIMMCIRRSTVNGNLAQLVALLAPFIRGRVGACTPEWQKAYVQDKAFEESNMSQMLMLGYAASEGRRKVCPNDDSPADHNDDDKQRYRIVIDEPDKVTKDNLSTLYGLLAG